MSDKMREAFKVAFRKAASEDVDYDEAVDRGLAAALTAQAEQHGGVSGWYCAQCQHGVDPVDVTFGEKHVYCGYPVTDCPAPPAPAVPSTHWSKPAARQWAEAVCTKSASPADRLLAVAAHVAGQRYALGESHESTLSHPDGEGAEVTPAPVLDADVMGQAASDHFAALINEDGTLAFDPCSSDDIDALVGAMLAAAPEVPR